MEIFGSKILVVVAHHDDIEFMFGGTLSKIKDKYKHIDIYICVLCSRQINTGELHRTVVLQQQKSFDVLGISPKKIFNHTFRSRFLPDFEDDVRLLLSSYKTEINPDSILTHYPEDPNQDHSSLFQQVFRVFRGATIIAGEVPNTGDTLQPNFFVKINEKIVEKKYQSLQCYEAEKNKKYFKKKSINALAYIRGLHSMKHTYCEALRIIRLHG